jgi:flagellar biosynthesis protein FlhB
MWAISGIVIAGTAKGLFGHHTIQDPKTGKASRTTTDFDNIKVSAVMHVHFSSHVTHDNQYMQTVLIISILALGLIKLSVVFLYQRIFSISRSFNIYSIILLILIVIWTIAFVFAFIFQCGMHPESAWTSVSMIFKYCYDTSGATAALALSNLIMDLMIIAAPMPIVWRLQMTMAQKF